jgi:Reverse transcriptase (RNA-dependent DNA polymerase)
VGRGKGTPNSVVERLHAHENAYGVPDAGIELMKRMQAGSWYSFTYSLGETAASAIKKGMKQGDPTSPARFLTFMDPLVKALCAPGCGWRPRRWAVPELNRRAGSGASMVTTSESDPSPAFVDDVVLLTVGREAIPEAKELLCIIEAWEPWGGIRVNLNKSGK